MFAASNEARVQTAIGKNNDPFFESKLIQSICPKSISPNVMKEIKKDVLWKRASKFFEEKNFVYFNSFHKFTKYNKNDSEMTKEEYISFFNYIETIFELSRNSNSIEHIDFEDIEDAYDFFVTQQNHLDKMMLEEDFPFDKYFQNYIFIGISSISFKRYLFA